jgi:hypothetical protein
LEVTNDRIWPGVDYPVSTYGVHSKAANLRALTVYTHRHSRSRHLDKFDSAVHGDAGFRVVRSDEFGNFVMGSMNNMKTPFIFPSTKYFDGTNTRILRYDNYG